MITSLTLALGWGQYYTHTFTPSFFCVFLSDLQHLKTWCHSSMTDERLDLLVLGYIATLIKSNLSRQKYCESEIVQVLKSSVGL